MNFLPSYDNYRQILTDIRNSGKYCDYWEAMEKPEFLILRHDIEFSVERAYEMSKIESEMGISSTYFLQITNNAYNAFSHSVKQMILEMYHRGHKIGLHYHIGDSMDPKVVHDEIVKQLRIMSDMYGIEIDRFSMHRPMRETEYYKTAIPGVINAYASPFFTFVDKIEENTTVEVKYIADSRHRWNYGTPDADTIRNFEKIQLLIHPDFWNASGYDAPHNFRLLTKEHSSTFLNTLDNECNHFSEYRETLENKLSSIL